MLLYLKWNCSEGVQKIKLFINTLVLIFIPATVYMFLLLRNLSEISYTKWITFDQSSGNVMIFPCGFLILLLWLLMIVSIHLIYWSFACFLYDLPMQDFCPFFFYCVFCVALNNIGAVSIGWMQASSLIVICTVTILSHNMKITSYTLWCQTSGHATNEVNGSWNNFCFIHRVMFFMWLKHSGKLLFLI